MAGFLAYLIFISLPIPIAIGTVATALAVLTKNFLIDFRIRRTVAGTAPELNGVPF